MADIFSLTIPQLAKNIKEGKISLINIEWQVVPLYEKHHKYYKIAEFLADYDFEFFNYGTVRLKFLHK